MNISRRRLLQVAALAPLAGLAVPRASRAQQGSATGGETPPIVFVHGNEDSAAVWTTVLWRFESNGIAGARLEAIDFTDPTARTDDAVPQAGRSSTDDELRELAAFIETIKSRTGAPQVALVGSSRGGYPIRNYIAANGGASVSHAVLCGVPNHGVFDWADYLPGNEFNGRGPFLRRLNGGETDVAPGVAFLTLRSDGNDKYAQPDGRFVGRKGIPTGITFEGPTLRGATNLALGQLDHRETAFHPRAFREIFRFIAGREPERIDIDPQPRVTLDGVVSGFVAGAVSNRPLAGASVELYRVSRDGERQGEPVHRRVTDADGRWGPAVVEPGSPLEFVLTAAGYPTTHIYRSPFPRSSAIVHMRPGRALAPAETKAGAVVVMSRPRGYFGIPRDVVLLDGREPTDIPPGVPGNSTSTVLVPVAEAGRAVSCIFNEERIIARAWPAADNAITVAELTY